MLTDRAAGGIKTSGAGAGSGSNTQGVELPRDRSHRFICGLTIALLAVAVSAGLLLAWPHAMGAIFYVPRLDSLFTELHRDPALIEALREQNAALADKDETWALEPDPALDSRRPNRHGPLHRPNLA